MRTHREMHLIRRLGRLATDLVIVILVIAAYSLAHNDEPDGAPQAAMQSK